MDEVVVRVAGVHKRYQLGKKEVVALRGVDLEVHANEFLALAGTSGSGKTTLLNLIGCLDEVTEGSLEVFGVATTTANDSGLSSLRATKLGFIFQNFNLIPVFSAVENVEYALIDQPISKEERRSRANTALALVGLSDRADHRPEELSGGQRQRVAIARAIVHRPKLIIADEPTASLDKTTATEILDLMNHIRESLGVTVVVASHDPLVLSRADRIISLSDGRITEISKAGRR
ncbi:ABC transporter ATP-binding protein [soil metagenome]